MYRGFCLYIEGVCRRREYSRYQERARGTPGKRASIAFLVWPCICKKQRLWNMLTTNCREFQKLWRCTPSVRVYSPVFLRLTRIMIAIYLVYAYCLSVLVVRLTPRSIPSLSPFVVCNSRKRIILKQSVTTVLPSKSTIPSSSVVTVSSNVNPLKKQNVYFPWNDDYGLCFSCSFID